MESQENAVVVRQETGLQDAATASEIVSRVARIQDVVKRIMKEGEHFGVIPGCKKPSLYQPGAELLLMTFRISSQMERVEDLSTSDEVRYRVTAAGLSPAGVFLGNHVGECSSNEEKYKWRRPVCNEEFDETPEDMRREVWKHNNYKNTNEKVKQVRTNPSDVANTILAMASKRAVVGMTRKVTGASSMFTDGVEDLPPEMVQQDAKPPVKMPQEKAPAPAAKPEPPAGADDNGETELVGVVKSVSRKTAGSRKPHGVCIITNDGEVWANTFHDTLIDDAESLKGKQAILHVERDKFGFKLVGVGAGE